MYTSPSLLVVGTGAMACLFAARLAAAGTSVSMLGSWPAGIQALREYGVRVVGQDGQEQAYWVQVLPAVEDCRAERFSYALVLVKAWQTAEAARQLSACLAPGGLALTLQNGLGNREILAGTLGEDRVALGITTIGANLLGPGRVQPAGEGNVSLSAHPRLDPLANLLRQAGFVVEEASDPTALIWGKLVINAAINPLTALLGVPNGELVVRPAARQLMTAAAREAAAVAAGLGIRLPYPDPALAAENVARRTAANRSSMLQDILRGAPTEIDAICGAIVQAGEAVRVPAPINQTLWLLVKARAGRAPHQPECG